MPSQPLEARDTILGLGQRTDGSRGSVFLQVGARASRPRNHEVLETKVTFLFFGSFPDQEVSPGRGGEGTET